jgi:hypothetical protein
MFVTSCVIALFSAAVARGHGSMQFNGGTTGTSKLQNAGGANILGSSNEITICAWVYQAGRSESGNGTVVALNASGNSMSLLNASFSDTLQFATTWTTTSGDWSFEVAEDTWNAIAHTYDRSDEGNSLRVRVNFIDVQADAGDTPEGTSVEPGVGYCIGNVSGQTATWDGRIAHVQLFNRILSTAELDACLRAPGSITNGLRLWLPMQNAGDVNDRSGNGFNATATDMTAGSDGPVVNAQHGIPRGTWQVPVGLHSVQQYVIPRFADGSNHPAGQLQEHGPASVIRGNSSTGSLSSSPVDSRAVR